jgi:transcriptional regulator with XRE-family HTH domain
MINAKQALRRSGENLRLIRTQKGYSIEALSVLSGIDAALIEQMEAGNFDFYISTVFNLADTLNVDFRQILVDATTFAG